LQGSFEESLIGLIGPLHIRRSKGVDQFAVRGVGKDVDPRKPTIGRVLFTLRAFNSIEVI
jgi:hypothetical protein